MAPLKGKKAWRKHIDGSAVVATLVEESHKARREPGVETREDEQLFFTDTTADAAAALAVTSGRRKRSREVKPTHAQLIIAEAHKAKPVPHPKRSAVGPLVPRKGSESAPRTWTALPDPTAHPLDLWADDGGSAAAAAAASFMVVGHQGRGLDAEGVPRPSKRTWRTNAPVSQSQIKAVEVDIAGCSYNPDHELHQDAMAQLVASEMKKVLRRELQPTAPPQLVDAEGEQILDELQQLQVEAAGTDDDENEIELDVDGAGQRPGGRPKKTKQDRNKQARRREEDKALAERRRAKRLRHDLTRLPEVAAELAAQQAEQELRRQRREVVKAEKAASQPPRLGKLKYEEPPVQVLLSEDITGSLRKVKAFPMLTADRFKSLQKRGLVEPRRPLNTRPQKKLLHFEKNGRVEKQREGQAELDSMVQARKAANRSAKSSKKAAAKLRVL